MPISIRSLAGTAILCCLASCVMTEKPLSDAKSSQVDEQLLGTWKEVLPQGANRAAATLEFRRQQGATNTMRIVRSVPNEKPQRYTTYARPGTPPMLSIGLEDDKGKVHWLPMKYEIDEGALRMAGLDKALFCAAVAEGKLQGERTKNDEDACTSVTLSTSPEDVLKFIAAHAGKAWADSVTYRRNEK